MQLGHLQAMGIPIFRQRRLLPGARLTLTYSVHPLRNSQDEIVAAILVEHTPEVLEHWEKILIFLQAVGRSLGLNPLVPSQTLQLSCDELKQNGYLPGSLRFVLIMGSQLGQMLYNTPTDFIGPGLNDPARVWSRPEDSFTVLMTHHPAAFLLQPPLKRYLWKELQSLDMLPTPKSC